MGLAVHLAIAKTNKWSSRESGDTAEVVERPGGGFSVVAVDGQGSGAAAKALSLMLTSRAVALLKEGVRDGAVARAVHDVLFAYRQGRVSASLDIVSVDLKTRTVLVTRNAETPLVVRRREGWQSLSPAAGPIGLYHFTRPAVTHLPTDAGLMVVGYTDGVSHAGDRIARDGFDVLAYLEQHDEPGASASDIADAVLHEAIRRDQGRPQDDMTVVVLALTDHDDDPLIRRLDAVIPLP